VATTAWSRKSPPGFPALYSGRLDGDAWTCPNVYGSAALRQIGELLAARGWNNLVVLQACLNGARRRSAHHAVPVKADEVARDAAACVREGAQDLHVHPKADDGRDSLDPDVVAQTLLAVRRAVPGIPVGVTTGLWAAAGSKPLDLVRNWVVRPDHVSINFHEPGAEQLARWCLEAGILVDAGLWTGTDGIRHLEASGLARYCRRLLIEVTAASPARAGALALVERLAPYRALMLLHGEEEVAWPALGWARDWGLLTRMGLEDTLALPDGSAARDNADLVRTAVGLLQAHS
jgi:uncharacterized protein (DUF849 family)